MKRNKPAFVTIIKKKKRIIDFTVTTVTSIGFAVIALLFILTPRLSNEISELLADIQSSFVVLNGEITDIDPVAVALSAVVNAPPKK